MMSIREQIKQLELEREQIKADLFDAKAEQAEQVRKWNVEGVSTPLEQRLDLQAKIADLEAQRQITKAELMKLKQIEDVLVDDPHLLAEIIIRCKQQFGV